MVLVIVFAATEDANVAPLPTYKNPAFVMPEVDEVTVRVCEEINPIVFRLIPALKTCVPKNVFEISVLA